MIQNGKTRHPAAEIRNNLISSLVSQVPAVKSGTNFVFLDIACSHKRAEVIRKENGLRELVEMLYGDQTLGAWRLYPYAYDRSTRAYQEAVAMPEGFLTRGQRQSEPAEHESLLMFRRSGREVVFLDKIIAEDGSLPTAIALRGIEQLASNCGQIEAWATASSPKARLAHTAWTSGLISTLQLKRLKSNQVSFRHLKYVAVRTALRRYVFNMRLYRFGLRP